MSYHPLKIQRLNEATELWEDHPTLRSLHALQVNKAGGGESFTAGADQFHRRLTFELRYNKELEAVIYNPQLHRVVYKGHFFNIVDYDDFMESHRTVRLIGESYE